MRHLIYFFLLVFLSGNIKAQYVECDSVFFEPVNRSYDLNQFCELNAGIPFEIMLSYIVLDSICSYANYNDWQQFLNNQHSLDDTLKTIMKYFYKVVDYNPMLFDKNLRYVFKDFAIHPISLYLDLRTKITELSPNVMLDRALLYSYFILKVRVDKVVNKVRPDSQTGKSLSFVNCTITDTIKGKIGPYCSNCYNTSTIHENIGFVTNDIRDSAVSYDIGTSFEFVYSPEWNIGEDRDFVIVDSSGVNHNGILDSLGNSWIKTNEEYLLFLETFEVCRDSTSFYTVLKPLGLGSKTFTMYPIKSDSTVYNPGNDFGFGSVSYTTFVNTIRNRINEIKNFGE